jgi:hypothetical protein
VPPRTAHLSPSSPPTPLSLCDLLVKQIKNFLTYGSLDAPEVPEMQALSNKKGTKALVTRGAAEAENFIG